MILYTSRELARAEGSDEALDVGRSVSDALVELVQRLDPGLPLAFCVAKGGITSSDIGTRGFGVRRAEVAGQMLPGTISVWILPEDSAFPGLPYVIFPGNVGEAGDARRGHRAARGVSGRASDPCWRRPRPRVAPWARSRVTTCSGSRPWCGRRRRAPRR